MTTPEFTWDGTGKQAAAIVQALRADGHAAAYNPTRREIHLIDAAGALHRINPERTTK